METRLCDIKRMDLFKAELSFRRSSSYARQADNDFESRAGTI